MSLTEDHFDYFEYDFDIFQDEADEAAIFYEETYLDILNYCVVSSVMAFAQALGPILVLNFGFVCFRTRGYLSETWKHLGTGLIGLYLINGFETSLERCILFLVFCYTYFHLYFIYKMKKTLGGVSIGTVIKLSTMPLLVFCEYSLVDKDVWMQHRGIVMVMAMKLISLAHDIEEEHFFPSSIEYFGYMLSGANIVFGPWISYQDYIRFQGNAKKINLQLIYSIIRSTLIAFFFLTISNCWADFLIPFTANKWLVGYKEALTVRTSHYFVCYLSEIGMIAAGFTPTDANRFEITDPLAIEFPTSLAIVVKKWDIPIHRFLKKYIYTAWVRSNKFCAILLTFLMSSILHGLELKVSVVLINIGLFSLMQMNLRKKISNAFQCCVAVRYCTTCFHSFKRDDVRVRILLVIYSFTTILHLIYLGVIMHPSVDEIGIFEKWRNLYFVGHIMMLVNIFLMF